MTTARKDKNMLAGMTQKGTDEFLQKVKDTAVEYAEVPPHAEYEIRWSDKSPESSEAGQALSQSIKGSGPMLIAALTD